MFVCLVFVVWITFLLLHSLWISYKGVPLIRIVCKTFNVSHDQIIHGRIANNQTKQTDKNKMKMTIDKRSRLREKERETDTTKNPK